MAASVQVVACVDGPLLVRGDVELLSSTGEPIERHRQTVALCRCGVSTIKPFCDGTHKLVGFRSETPHESDDDPARDEPPDAG